ncbi:hypothetical protein IMCC26207_1107 [Actinobacteria bacterium IMCC26207]|nr:hypothetical protein IMCC26207_1107 [Actinobacteria bacterium IMCC26207]MCX6525604.1 hypothetical protein [Actinomycetota bacterium]
MAFGQASGPPAAVQQLNRLAELLAERGFDSFKEARHPFGLTQRQAAGKFSSGEASELIERLEAESVVSAEPLPSTTSRASSKKPAVPAAAKAASRTASSRPSRSATPAAAQSAEVAADSAQVGSSKTTGAEVPQSAAAQARAIKKRKAREEEVATRIESEVMANELVSRGWCCIAPE